MRAGVQSPPREPRRPRQRKSVPWRRAEKTWAERRRGVVATAPAKDAAALRRMGALRGWHVAMRNSGSVSVARCAAKVDCMRYPLV
jgi:hypothetical protein